MKLFIREALGYGLVSAFAFIVDIAILWALVRWFSWGYLWAATASFIAGLVIGYALSVTLVFKYRRLRDQRFEFAGFAAVGAIAMGINAAAMAVGVKWLGLHYLIAKCTSAAFTFAWNFLARRQLLFVERRAA
jgi:putative flippase GtrA